MLHVVVQPVVQRPLATAAGCALHPRTAVALAMLAILTSGSLHAQVPSREAESQNPAPIALQGTNYDHTRAPVARAVRATGGITLDGRLDDATWAVAPPISDFTQELPVEGAPATRSTEVRFVFDDAALYVAAVLRDPEPVTGRLMRRDPNGGDFDYFRVSIDSYHDHETAYRFSVNPSGTIRDDIVAGGGQGGGDSSWDPVWDASTLLTEDGWSVEMRIPFSQLRFGPADEQIWGVRVERNVHRAQEFAVFPFVPTLERGGASRFAHLEGIRGIEPGQRLEITPYLAGRGEYLQIDSPTGVAFANPYRSGSDHFVDAGADLKYRLTSNITLDATVNPDFGQVELDPSVINLTAFETRYEERRPFFVEGADIFSFGEGGPAGSTGRGPQLLYSRRIGRAPQGAVPSNAVYSEAASSTTILGAAKITGRTAGGWSLGLLESVTAEEVARYADPSGGSGEAVVEPASNYLVGRVRRQIRGGETRFGLIGAAANRRLADSGMEARLHSSAYSGGMDFAHEWSNRTYRLAGVFTASHVAGSTDAILRTQRSSTRYYQRPDSDHTLDPDATSLSGYYAMVDIAKMTGAFGAKLAIAGASPGYEVNDLGFQSASDRVIVDTNLSYAQPNPGRFLRRWDTRGSPDAVWNYAGDRVFTEVNGDFNWQFLNYWGGGVRLAYNPSFADDRLTRGGPIAATPSRISGHVNLNSDARRTTVGRMNFQWGKDDAGGWETAASLNLTSNPNERLEIRVGPNFTRRLETAQYVTSVADALATNTFARRYVFADLDQTTLGLGTRVNVTFTPTLSLQLYAEPFISTGDYQRLKEFATPGTFEFRDYGEEIGTLVRLANGDAEIDPDGDGPATQFTISDRDFSYRSLLGNAVLRWEWRRGSTFYLVWQQRRIDSVTGIGASGTNAGVGEFEFSRDVGDMFGARPDNILVIKFNYWLNP